VWCIGFIVLSIIVLYKFYLETKPAESTAEMVKIVSKLEMYPVESWETSNSNERLPDWVFEQFKIEYKCSKVGQFNYSLNLRNGERVYIGTFENVNHFNRTYCFVASGGKVVVELYWRKSVLTRLIERNTRYYFKRVLPVKSAERLEQSMKEFHADALRKKQDAIDLEKLL
jgi:hypothetical protein